MFKERWASKSNKNSLKWQQIMSLLSNRVSLKYRPYKLLNDMKFIKQRFWSYQVCKVNMTMNKLHVKLRLVNNKWLKKIKIMNSFMMSLWKLCRFLKAKTNFNKGLKKIMNQKLNKLISLTMLKRMMSKRKSKWLKSNKNLLRNCQSNNLKNPK